MRSNQFSRDMDEAEKFDMDLLDKMKKYGLMGIPYSKEYGGEGADVLTYALAMEEVSKVDASAGITISVHTSLCCSCINDYASEEQKQKFLRPLVDGSKIGCFGLTEPGAGTDASGVKTTAKLDGDHYVLNGQKVFTTNSGFADTSLIFAYTDKSAGTRGMSAFIVDRDSEGLTVSKDIPRMGIRAASNAEVALVDVKVPKENLIGKTVSHIAETTDYFTVTTVPDVIQKKEPVMKLSYLPGQKNPSIVVGMPIFYSNGELQYIIATNRELSTYTNLRDNYNTF